MNYGEEFRYLPSGRVLGRIGLVGVEFSLEVLRMNNDQQAAFIRSIKDFFDPQAVAKRAKEREERRLFAECLRGMTPKEQRDWIDKVLREARDNSARTGTKSA